MFQASPVIDLLIQFVLYKILCYGVCTLKNTALQRFSHCVLSRRLIRRLLSFSSTFLRFNLITHVWFCPASFGAEQMIFVFISNRVLLVIFFNIALAIRIWVKLLIHLTICRYLGNASCHAEATGMTLLIILHTVTQIAVEPHRL